MTQLTSCRRLVTALIVLLVVGGFSFAHAAVADDQLTAALAKLEKAGVVADAAYWRDNAQRNRTCSGEKVAALLVAGAKAQGGKAEDLDGALKHLMKRRVLSKTEYWTKNAVAGKECSGGQVASLISRLAGSTK